MRATIHFFTGVDFTADVIENQVQAVSITTAVVSQLHSATTRPVIVWFVIGGLPLSLKISTTKNDYWFVHVFMR